MTEWIDQLKWVSGSTRHNPSAFNIEGKIIGRGECMVMAGPCSVESKQQIVEIAQAVSQCGATVLRGGAFKPRTSPYDFQGLGERALKWMREAADKSGLLCVSEIMSPDQLRLVESYVDILQIGSRNMQNYPLLKAVGRSKKPILLKRGFAATYKEFLCAAEYIMNAGNLQVILCERGIRTFETYTRNTLDMAAIPVLRELTHLPIIVDPSHGVGMRQAIAPMSRAAVAAQADGLMIEVHTEPDQSVSDAAQAIGVEAFSDLMKSLRAIGKIVGRQIRKPPSFSNPTSPS